MPTGAGNTLYVDLDGTLIHSDLLVESLVDALRRNPLYLLLMPLWLLRGKAWLKQQIALRASIRVDLLPYNQALLEQLRAKKRAGRKLILLSASNQALVDAVANHLGIFDAAIGSTARQNLSGRSKLDRIHALQSGQAFAYAGNARVDLPIWEQADEAITVNLGARLQGRKELQGKPVTSFDSSTHLARELLRAMRPHQWLKNVLILLPLLLMQSAPTPELMLQASLGFIAFCLTASSVYLLNDLLDLEADRQHHEKRHRPFAAGSLDPRLGLLVSPLLLISAFLLAWWATPQAFVMVLGLYFLSTLIYSFLFKRIVLVDVITLAVLYTLRIIAGAAVIPVIPSFWLMAFSMFIFMSLAMVKRYTELNWLRESGFDRAQGRGYLAGDLDMMAILGSSSALMSVLVFALYINSEAISLQYATPEVLWFVCPLLLYLLSRTWLLAHRGQLEEDPVIFALRDRISQLVVLAAAFLFYLAQLDWRHMLPY